MISVYKFDLQMFATTTVPQELVEKAWAKQLWREAEKENFFAKFTGTSNDSIVQVKTELKKDKGDQITVPLVMKLNGAGITGDQMLEGSEEAMQFYDCPVVIDQIRHAVRLEGAMTEQKTSLNLRNAAKEGLKVWFAEKMEQMIVDALTTAPDTAHVVYAGAKTSVATVTATDTFSADLISIAARKAKTATPKIRRPKVDGKEYYVMLVDPYQARDLKNDQKWLEAQKHANVRGDSNPIFTGMLGIYDGVVVHEYEYLPRTASGASSAMVGKALLLGCQAAIKAIGKEAFWKEKAFDYDNQVGFATGAILGFKKAKFNNKDFACIQVVTASKED